MGWGHSLYLSSRAEPPSERYPPSFGGGGFFETPRKRGAGGGRHRSVCPEANLALWFGAGRFLHHRCRVTAFVMCNGWGRSRLPIDGMINPHTCVASDHISGGTIGSRQTKSTPTIVCAPQILLAIALGTSVGWADQGTQMPFLFPLRHSWYISHTLMWCWSSARTAATMS